MRHTVRNIAIDLHAKLLIDCLTIALERLTNLEKDGCFLYHYNRRLMTIEMELMK